MTLLSAAHLLCLDAKRLVAFSTAWHVSVLSVLVLLVMVTGSCQHCSPGHASSMVIAALSTVVISALVPVAAALVPPWVLGILGGF